MSSYQRASAMSALIINENKRELAAGQLNLSQKGQQGTIETPTEAEVISE